jgi:hypothetical protein
MEWVNKMDKEALLDLLSQLDLPSFRALEDSLLELRRLALEELLESQQWHEFTETRGGIKVLDKILEIRGEVQGRIENIEQEHAYGYDDNGDGPGSGGGQGGYG